MVAADRDPVVGLLAQLGYAIAPKDLDRRIATIRQTDDHALWVACANDDIVGFLHIFARPALEKPPEAVVQAMVVEAACRHGGIGRQLMDKAEEWTRNRGFSSIALSSQINRSGAHAFYEKLGFQTAATSHLLRKEL